MITMSTPNVQQHGPFFDTSVFQNYLFVGLLLISIAAVIIVLSRFVFPKHTKEKIIEKRKQPIPQKTPKKDIVADTNEIEATNAPERHAPPIKVALRLLAADERRVVQALIDAQGSMLQKDISWNTGLSRVKTHRVLDKLTRRGIVTSEKYYNTKKVTLADWLVSAQNPSVSAR
jgi:uncharacterized membrane protein